VWAELRRPLHLLHAISRIVSTFSERPDIVPARDRRCFTSDCRDEISRCVNILYASTEPGREALVGQLKAAQARLQRMKTF